MSKKHDFKIQPLGTKKIPYNPLIDKHLEYFFANKNNRQILVRTRVVNRKNQILDKDLCKLADHGLINVPHKFRVKKNKNKKYREQYRSLQSRSKLNQTVEKSDFDKFMESQRNNLKSKNNTVGARNSHQSQQQKIQRHTQQAIIKDQ